MGNNFCTLDQKNNQVQCTIESPISKHESQDQKENHSNNHQTDAIQEESNPLNQFISKHQNDRTIVASNNLNISNRRIQKKKTRRQTQALMNLSNQKKKNFVARSNHIGFIKELKSSFRENYISDLKDQNPYQRIQINQGNFIHLRKQSIKNYYSFKDQVGKGAYGSVYKAICTKSEEKRAIKVIKKKSLQHGNHKQIFAELQLLKKLDHPNIIKLYQVFQSTQNYYIVTEFCEGGSVIDFINNRATFDDEVIKIIFRQILGCLNYLHNLKIVHRDIKLQNLVFVDKLKGKGKVSTEDIEIKLLDFGTAYQMNKPRISCRSLVGTLSYMPPEIIKGYFTDRCDLWSCGVILHILLTSRSPFRCSRKQDTLDRILNHEITFQESIWTQVNVSAKNLLIRMLQKNPYKRISARQALQHPWLKMDIGKSKVKHSTFVQNLASYYRQNNLISVLETYLIFSKISQSQRHQISEIFKSIDKNCDGQIQAQQLMLAYKQYCPNATEQQIQHILNQIDKDKSGKIGLNQFTSAMISHQKLFAKNSLQEAFDYFDTDKTGYIQKKQLAQILKGSNKGEIQDLFTQIDVDHDKRVSKKQFLDYLLKKGCLY